jgi:hypothetical protein
MPTSARLDRYSHTLNILPRIRTEYSTSSRTEERSGATSLLPLLGKVPGVRMAVILRRVSLRRTAVESILTIQTMIVSRGFSSLGVHL